MKSGIIHGVCLLTLVLRVAAQTAVDLPHPEQKDRKERAVAKRQDKRAQRADLIFRGAIAFNEKELRSQLKEQITTIQDYGLSAARADDVAFFLELFYRKHGYARVEVRYFLEGGSRLALDIKEGPLTTLGEIRFVGNATLPADKLFEYAVGPTRERYSKLQKALPFVAADIEEGVDLVHRLYVAEGFLDSVVDPPRYADAGPAQVNVTVTIHEGIKYSFGAVSFSGHPIYDADSLRGQMLDLLEQPYTDGRVADIPRRLQAYYKARGYFAVKVEATGEPLHAVNGRVGVTVAIEPGPVYRFDGVKVTGLDKLRSSYITKRFEKLSGQTYSPDLLDTKFRDLMRTGLFNVLRINPTPIPGDELRLDIAVEEAKSREFGFSLGFGSYTGLILGVQFSDRDLFGYGRPITTSAEYSQRGYKAEILFEDPYFLDTDYKLRAKLSALTYDFDGYSKFELGGRVELTRKITKHYDAGLVLGARHVDVTSADIDPGLLGRPHYFVSSIGLTQTLDLRDSPVIPNRGLIFDNTFDVASSVLGSDVDFVRSTARLTYYQPFGRTLLTLGARGGIIRSLKTEGSTLGGGLPIDERFFNGGSTTVRSFTERDLGPRERNRHPTGGEFFTIFNIEYTFPIYGELQGAVFVDAGNLLPSSDAAGLDDMRYALGAGLRYKLPIGPVRLDYGYNPDQRPGEDPGAFHFSFGFAF